jgi:glycogen debranching enzyme
MPVEIKVGPPVLTINQGTTFMVTDERGEILAGTDQGVFANDTRFLSYYQLFINGLPWELLTSAAVNYYAVRVELANPLVPTDDHDVAAHDIGLTVRRRVAEGIHEDLDLTNYSQQPVHFQLEIALRSDFADLFEVRVNRLVRRGNMVTTWHAQRGELVTRYANRDFERALVYRVVMSDAPPTFANGRVTFDVHLPPMRHWHACADYVLVADHQVHRPRHSCDPVQESGSELGRLQAEWTSQATKLTSANEDVYRTFTRSVEDMGALRMHGQDLARDVWVPAAGVPWYVALFGRDSLIASLQNMIVQAPFARGALQRLAEHQATEIDNWRDAEPGKILHELRVGELAHFNKIPHTPYYGTADATTLYLIVLHETWRWSGSTALLERHRAAAEACLEWIDRYGDLDGDGFQEYRTRSTGGYENMGWKDSEDAILYPDGSPVRQPKGLCELQGYVFDAKLRMAEVFEALREPQRAARLRREAFELQERFEDAFWCEDIGFYALGLDPAKMPIKSIASNAGHLLWSGIARPDRAERVMRRFLEPDMWSGWGIRTLSADHPGYNPYSYHRGSIWPHDNGIIALGFKRYGFAATTARLARDIFEAAAFFSQYRLPELYAGLPRQPGSFPVQYVGANVPQAWASGSVFHLLQALLGLRADAPRRRLYVQPTLPRWLPTVTLDGIEVAGTRLRLAFRRDGDESRWDVQDQAGEPPIEVVEAPWEVPAGSEAAVAASS